MHTPAEILDAEATLVPTGADGRVVDDGAPEAVAQGDRVGRYVVLRRLGAGGMGTVYLAYDPELDRKVAIKLLRGPDGAVDPLTLQREAQAMAKLQHPNVITVHDVGEHRGRVYVAMELVEGRTLRAWLEVERRGWRDVLEVFVLAGRGLGAAHERGLIHRDFKPDNVMVSNEGRVLVMDFGLARSRRDVDEEPDVDVRSFRGSVLDAATVGRLVGTPAYMAPEQVIARELTPAVDQFAFCVSLWEGLCGERPFEGDLVAELFANISEGRIRTPPARARRPGMPGWLRRVLQRGLAPRPEARWSSMAALLAALEQGRRRGRRHALLAASTLAIGAVGLSWALQEQRERERREAMAACEAEGAIIDEVWNEPARARLRSGMLATGARFAPHGLEILVPWLDAYHDAWSEGRTEACVHASIERDWDEELADRSSWCFEDRKLQLEATVEQISTLSRASARRAVRIASYLDPVSTCLDPDLLQRLPAPPLELRDEIRAIRAMLSQSDRLQHAGRYVEGLGEARRARERAEALGWSPLSALARFVEGRNAHETGRSADAEVTLVRAYFEAQQAGSIEVAFRVARSLVIVNTALERYREAEVWLRHADVLSSSLEDPSGLDEAEGHYLASSIHGGIGDYETAAAEGERAVALRTAALGPDHPITAAAARNLGVVYLAQDRFREALALFEHAFSVWEDAVGHEHPYVGDLAMYRGKVEWAEGRADEALAHLREGLAIHEQTLGAEHPKTLRSREQLGRLLLALGRLDEAEPLLERVMEVELERHGPRRSLGESLLAMAEVDRARGREAQALERCARALELIETSLDPGHPDLAAAMERVAVVYWALGRRDEAIARRREALARREAALGGDHRRLMSPLVALGNMLYDSGQPDAARRSHVRALSIGERVLGPLDAALVPSLTGLARVALGEGDVDAALTLAERAVRLAEDEHVGPRWAGDAHFVRARALRASGDASGRTRSLATQAMREHALGHDEERRAEVERWLAELPSSTRDEPGTIDR